MLTADLIDAMARRVAVAMNGGHWDTHYIEPQKAFWRRRVLLMIEGKI